MNKFLTKVAKIFLGLSMAAGVGVAISNNKKIYSAQATDTYNVYEGVLTEGDYILAYHNAGNSTNESSAMKAVISSSRLSYTNITTTSITDPSVDLVWHIAPSGNYWTIYNANKNKYAASTGANNKAQLLDSGSDDKALWSCTSSSTSTTYDFVNKYNSANSKNPYLRNNADKTNNYGFACYSVSTNAALTLYKKAVVSQTISTTPSDLSNVYVGQEIVVQTSASTATWSITSGASYAEFKNGTSSGKSVTLVGIGAGTVTVKAVATGCADATKDITFKADTITSLTATVNNSKIFRVGESISANDITVAYTKASGANGNADASSYTVGGTTGSTWSYTFLVGDIGTKNFTVLYSGSYTTLAVTVESSGDLPHHPISVTFSPANSGEVRSGSSTEIYEESEATVIVDAAIDYQFTGQVEVYSGQTLLSLDEDFTVTLATDTLSVSINLFDFGSYTDDVTIVVYSEDFVEELQSITISSDEGEYTVGDAFVMPIVTAHYKRKVDTNVTTLAKSTYDKFATEDQVVTISYTENSVTKTAEYYAAMETVTPSSKYVLVTEANQITNGQYLLVYGTKAFNGRDTGQNQDNFYETVDVLNNEISYSPATAKLEMTLTNLTGDDAGKTSFKMSATSDFNADKWLSAGTSDANAMTFVSTQVSGMKLTINSVSNSRSTKATGGHWDITGPGNNVFSFNNMAVGSGGQRFRFYKTSSYTGESYYAVDLYKKVATAASLVGIEVKLSNPAKEYQVGDTLSASDFVVKKVYNSGTKEVVTNYTMSTSIVSSTSTSITFTWNDGSQDWVNTFVLEAEAREGTLSRIVLTVPAEYSDHKSYIQSDDPLEWYLTGITIDVIWNENTQDEEVISTPLEDLLESGATISPAIPTVGVTQFTVSYSLLGVDIDTSTSTVAGISVVNDYVNNLGWRSYSAGQFTVYEGQTLTLSTINGWEIYRKYKSGKEVVISYGTYQVKITNGGEDEVVTITAQSPYIWKLGDTKITMYDPESTKSTSKTMTVQEDTLSSITATCSKTFKVGDIIKKSDITLTGSYASGSREITDFTFADYQFTYADAASGGASTEKSFIINYSNKSDTLTVNVSRSAYVAPENEDFGLDISLFSDIGGSNTNLVSGTVTDSTKGITYKYHNAYYYKGKLSFSKDGQPSDYDVEGTLENLTPFNRGIADVNMTDSGNNEWCLSYSVDGETWIDWTDAEEQTNYYYFMIHYTDCDVTNYTNISSITITFKGEETAENVANYIMFEDTEGQCETEGNTIGKFWYAESYFNNMSVEERQTFMESNEYVIATARERLIKWAAHHHKVISGGSSYEDPYVIAPAPSLLPVLFSSANTNQTVAIIVIISMVSVTAIGGYFFLRKRKENI